MTTNISKKRKVCGLPECPAYLLRNASMANHPGTALLRPLAAPRIVSEQIFCACLQFVADGVFYAELNELLTRELAEHGYSGVEVRVTPMRTEIIIRATRTQNVLGECHHLHLPVTRAQWCIIADLRL
jgi:hypothetical protein